jgi:hypothetical protein
MLSSALVNVSLISYMTQFDSSSFTDPEYELVAIHPEHFLPYGNVLPVFHSATSTTPTMYVSASDRRLRESPGELDNRCLPTFHHVAESRNKYNRLNVFLVILNAEIKFHRYLRMIKQNPPTTPLPDDVLDLMHLAVELVDLLYWKPMPTKGSPGEAVFSNTMKYLRDREKDNPTRSRSNLDVQGDFVI